MDIPQAKVTSDRTHSTVSYEPINDLDYGTLLCWGSNDQGSQLEPCVFHIVPAGKYQLDLLVSFLEKLKRTLSLLARFFFYKGYIDAT